MHTSIHLHSSTLTSVLQVLSTIVHDLGDISRGLSDNLLERIKDRSQKSPVGRNEDMQLLLGKVHRQLGRINQAESILEAFIDRTQQTFGRNHICKLFLKCNQQLIETL